MITEHQDKAHPKHITTHIYQTDKGHWKKLRELVTIPIRMPSLPFERNKKSNRQGKHTPGESQHTAPPTRGDGSAGISTERKGLLKVPRQTCPTPRRRVTFQDTLTRIPPRSQMTRPRSRLAKEIMGPPDLNQIIEDSNSIATELRRMAWSIEYHNALLQKRADDFYNPL